MIDGQLSPWLQVRREYRKFFRANAGKKIYDFTIQRIVSRSVNVAWCQIYLCGLAELANPHNQIWDKARMN